MTQADAVFLIFQRFTLRRGTSYQVRCRDYAMEWTKWSDKVN